MQHMASTPSDCGVGGPVPKLELKLWLDPPGGVPCDVTVVSQPNPAKWKIVDKSEGVIVLERGIQLNRCDRQFKHKTAS